MVFSECVIASGATVVCAQTPNLTAPPCSYKGGGASAGRPETSQWQKPAGAELIGHLEFGSRPPSEGNAERRQEAAKEAKKKEPKIPEEEEEEEEEQEGHRSGIGSSRSTRGPRDPLKPQSHLAVTAAGRRVFLER